MSNQRTFASMAWSTKGKVTHRERFLAEMDAVIPWARLLRLIEPHYPKAGNGRQPLGLQKLLRIVCCESFIGDEGWPLEAGLQGRAANRHKLRG